jgi:hypothetical protein
VAGGKEDGILPFIDGIKPGTINRQTNGKTDRWTDR